MKTENGNDAIKIIILVAICVVFLGIFYGAVVSKLEHITENKVEKEVFWQLEKKMKDLETRNKYIENMAERVIRAKLIGLGIDDIKEILKIKEEQKEVIYDNTLIELENEK